ncbi:hypothetical protein C8F04DRAFT_1236642 [Mycena alexandri]|uniref:Uncharacterized protein n=1 Tax=Mycena alexandri TaxID=1745969 RepID=A0AAD6SM17_9AGAR|nr:hypothetical protein C8F04DRAFT_1236642 [Mycena alexandri]
MANGNRTTRDMKDQWRVRQSLRGKEQQYKVWTSELLSVDDVDGRVQEALRCAHPGPRERGLPACSIRGAKSATRWRFKGIGQCQGGFPSLLKTICSVKVDVVDGISISMFGGGATLLGRGKQVWRKVNHQGDGDHIWVRIVGNLTVVRCNRTAARQKKTSHQTIEHHATKSHPAVNVFSQTVSTGEALGLGGDGILSVKKRGKVHLTTKPEKQMNKKAHCSRRSQPKPATMAGGYLLGTHGGYKPQKIRESLALG